MNNDGGSATQAAAVDAHRVRQFEHIDGQFAVHVYLPVKLTAPAAADLHQCCATLEAGGAHEIPPDELHVSLSRTFTLSRSQLEGFADALRRALRRRSAVRVPLDASLAELPNDTRTRFFAALELRRGTDGHAAVCSLIDTVDAVVARYGQTCFYAERRLHISVAWALAPLCSSLSPLPAALASWRPLFDSVACRIGERVSTFNLASAF